jgi:RNA polymerase sigma-70 factor (ECF subfamily)
MIGSEKNRLAERKFEDTQDLLAIQETLRGDRRAFEGVVRRYTPVLYSLAYRLLGAREEAEEAVQETFLRAFRALPRFRLGRRFHPWLYAIALNYLRTRYRRERRRAALRARPLEEALDVPGAPQTGADPAGEVERAAAERLAQEALEGLPSRYREVFVLRQIEGLAVREVAEILGLPEGTVKSFLHRGRALLIARLADEGVIGSGA